MTFIYNSSKLVKEDFLMLKFESWIENNIRYMECQICYDPVSNIDESVTVFCVGNASTKEFHLKMKNQIESLQVDNLVGIG